MLDLYVALKHHTLQVKLGSAFLIPKGTLTPMPEGIEIIWVNFPKGQEGSRRGEAELNVGGLRVQEGWGRRERRVGTHII